MVLNTNIQLHKAILFVLVFSLILFACKKTISNSQETPPDLDTKVYSQLISGFVTDENNLLVQNATVEAGSQTMLTDKFGYFEFHNVNVRKNCALVTVTKTGFFKGFRTYIANADKSIFLRIKLVPKTIAGNISASAGGSVTLTNGMSISLPANSITNAETNTAYIGTVNIAARWINPEDTDLMDIMPGDLRGLNSSGNLQLLTTFGMTAVELMGSGGELLKIATGKKASLTFPLAGAFISAAPQTIPLWYFDETVGLWKEEGKATKSGNSYMASVEHFSFWNCDVPNNYVQFSCKITDSSGRPLQFMFVKISDINNPVNSRGAYTDSTGYIAGAVPDKASLQLKVFADRDCNTALFTKDFTTNNDDVNLGNVSVSEDAAYITGTVTDCNNMPVSNGAIFLQKGDLTYTYHLNNTGTYSFVQMLCGNGGGDFTFTGFDYTYLKQSNPAIYALRNGNTTVPNIQACDISILEYYNYTVNGVPHSLTKPPDNIRQYVTGVPLRYYIDANGNSSSSLFFEGANMGVGSQQPFVAFRCPQHLTQTDTNPVTVSITEYGLIGEYVAGNFSGELIDRVTNTLYNVSCNFRIKRIF